MTMWPLSMRVSQPTSSATMGSQMMYMSSALTQMLMQLGLYWPTEMVMTAWHTLEALSGAEDTTTKTSIQCKCAALAEEETAKMMVETSQMARTNQMAETAERQRAHSVLNSVDVDSLKWPVGPNAMLASKPISSLMEGKMGTNQMGVTFPTGETNQMGVTFQTVEKPMEQDLRVLMSVLAQQRISNAGSNVINV